MNKKYTKNNEIGLASFVGVQPHTVYLWRNGVKALRPDNVGVKRKFALIMLGFNILSKHIQEGDFKNEDDALDFLLKKYEVTVQK